MFRFLLIKRKLLMISYFFKRKLKVNIVEICMYVTLRFLGEDCVLNARLNLRIRKEVLKKLKILDIDLFVTS